MCGMNDLADVWLPGLVETRDAGRTWAHFRLQIDAPGRNYSDVDMLRLADGRLMAVVREDEAPDYRICQLFSSDDGATWTAPEPTGFTGSSFCLVQLRDSILCIHRDYAAGRAGRDGAPHARPGRHVAVQPAVSTRPMRSGAARRPWSACRTATCSASTSRPWTTAAATWSG